MLLINSNTTLSSNYIRTHDRAPN